MSGNRLYICHRTAGPIAIDGRLDEADWRAADAMTLVLTDTGSTPKLRTDVRALWDDTYLYVGFHSVDTDIWATMTGHDQPLWDEEVVEVFLDPGRIETAYFELVVNPLNVLTDVFVLNRGARKLLFQPMREWECVGVRHAVSVHGDPTSRTSRDHWWTVEFAIPFDQLVTAPHIPPSSGEVWKANFYRIERGRDATEYTAWSPTGEINYHHPECFGALVFAGEPVRASGGRRGKAPTQQRQ